MRMSCVQATDDRSISKSVSSEEEGLAGALAKALAARSAVLKGSMYNCTCGLSSSECIDQLYTVQIKTPTKCLLYLQKMHRFRQKW